MKTAKLVDIQKFEVAEIEEPQLVNADDVKIRVKAVGVCGTDLHIFKNGRADVTFPRVMGHELSGEVVATGDKVTRVSVGDHVVLDPVFACGECPTCKKGHPNVCSSVKCYGVQMDGGYQDYIVVGEKHLYKYDKNISYEAAALAEPFSIASNILFRASLTKEDNLIIIGAGTIGLSILQVAKMIGARVLVTDVIDEKLNIAKSMGADMTVNSKTESLETAAEEFSKGGFDVVIDAVGVTPLFVQSLNYAAPCARVMCIGFDAKPAEIPPVVITKKELSIIGSRMNCNRFPEVMKWLEDGKIAAEKMITKKVPVSDIQRGFEETLADSAGSVKTIITF